MSYDLISYRSALVCATLLGAALVGCSDSNPLTPQAKDLAALRQAVAPLRELSAAKQAGYTVAVGDPSDGHTCLSDPPLGAMGIHYLNTTLVDDTVVVSKPEIMIYEPQQDGSSQFVGVEYIVPYSIHGEDQSPPVLFGQNFTKNATFQLWGLHVWVGRNNPSGTFAMWNPDVSCQFAH
jgi:hypothetical protein